MGLDVWFREDVTRILTAAVIARNGLTAEERVLLAAICSGFGVSLREALPDEAAPAVIVEGCPRRLLERGR